MFSNGFTIFSPKLFLFCTPFSLGTLKKWCPSSHSRTGSCRSCTDSSARSKTTGRPCLSLCHGPLLCPPAPLPSPLVGPGRSKSNSGLGLTLIWTTMELHILVQYFFQINIPFNIPLLPLHISTQCFSSHSSTFRFLLMSLSLSLVAL